MLRRSGGTVRAGEEMTLLPTRISPAEGSTKPAISRKVVVLPQPDGPSRHTRRPCSTVSEMSSTTASSPYSLVRPRNSTEATSSPRRFGGDDGLVRHEPAARQDIRTDRKIQPPDSLPQPGPHGSR